MGESRQTKRDQDGVAFTGEQNALTLTAWAANVFSAFLNGTRRAPLYVKIRIEKSAFHVLINPTDQPFTYQNAIFVLHEHM